MEANPELAMTLLREARNARLKASDVYVLPDYPHVSRAMREAWLAYRQALRDLPLTATPSILADGTLNLESVRFPTPPS